MMSSDSYRSWELSPRLKKIVLNPHCIVLLSGDQPKVHSWALHWWRGRGLNTTERLRGRGRREGARPRSVMARPRSQVHQHRHRLTINCHLGLLSTLFTFGKPLVHIFKAFRSISMLVKYPQLCESSTHIPVSGVNPLHASRTLKNFM